MNQMETGYVSRVMALLHRATRDERREIGRELSAYVEGRAAAPEGQVLDPEEALALPRLP